MQTLPRLKRLFLGALILFGKLQTQNFDMLTCSEVARIWLETDGVTSRSNGLAQTNDVLMLKVIDVYQLFSDAFKSSMCKKEIDGSAQKSSWPFDFRSQMKI